MTEIAWGTQEESFILSRGDVRLEYVPKEERRDYSEELRLIIGTRSFRIIPQTDVCGDAQLSVLDECEVVGND